jgi:exoribonuclease-2
LPAEASFILTARKETVKDSSQTIRGKKVPGRPAFSQCRPIFFGPFAINMNEGKTVEYIDQGKFICTLCIEDRNGKLHLLTTTNREVNLSLKRVLLISKSSLIEPTLPRDELLLNLRLAEERRDKLKEKVKVKELWELIHDENESFDYAYLAELSFGELPGDDHISALVRALFEDKLHFKLKDGRFQPNTEHRIEEILRQKEEEERRETVLSEGSDWLRRSLEGESPPEPGCSEEVLRLVSELALHGNDAAEYKQARELLSRAGYSDPKGARRILVALGVWEEDENLDLLRRNIRTEFSEELIRFSEDLRNKTVDTSLLEDLRHLESFTIDGPLTRDFDDALSLEIKDGEHEVGVHITDVAAFLEPDSPLDIEARNRGTSLYLPRRHIPMIPPSLSQDTLSLKMGCDRPAVSLLCRLGGDGEVLSYRFTRSLIKVKRQLTYDEVNEGFEQDEVLSEMHRLATAFQQQRIESGALVLSVPEESIQVDDEGIVHFRKMEQNTPGRMLVAEFMILYNWLAARFCRDKKIPVLYRAQAEPSERLNRMGMDELFYVFMQRRKLQPMLIDTDPGPHAGLGLDAYTNISSPIRRYLDLVIQRQIRSAIMGEPAPYDEDELEKIRMVVQGNIKELTAVRRSRTRYWIQKYLMQNRDLKLSAFVIWSTRRKHRLLLTEVLLMTDMKRKNGQDFEPGQLIEVAVEKSNPWEDELVLSLVDTKEIY